MEPRRYSNLDAAESVFFERQLEHIRAGVIPIAYPEFKARLFLPVASGINPGDDRFVYREEDMVGKPAKLIADYSDDLPRADVLGREFSSPLRDLGVSFGYSQREIRAAAKVGMDLPAKKARAARRMAELALDDIAASGHTEGGLKGFVNHDSVTPDNAVTGDWDTATAEEILGDMNEPVQAMRSATLGMESPTTMLLPEDQYTLIAQRRADSISDSTILKFFLSTNPWIKEVLPWYKLAGAGDSATDRMVVYQRNPDALELLIPEEFNMLAPQERNLEIVVPCTLISGGVVLYKPATIVYRDGI